MVDRVLGEDHPVDGSAELGRVAAVAVNRREDVRLSSAGARGRLDDDGAAGGFGTAEGGRNTGFRSGTAGRSCRRLRRAVEVEGGIGRNPGGLAVSGVGVA